MSIIRMRQRVAVAQTLAVALLMTAFTAAPRMALAADATTADTSNSLQEIVVTAQFRKQNLQDTPIAITAINAATLDARNETSLASVAAEAPNVLLLETGGAFGPGMTASIRGIGQYDFDPALEPGVGIYVDDVYYPSLTGANFDLLDLDRVEVSRGPQGVLGGRNSEGGAIKLYSQKPQGDDTGSVSVSYGSRSLLEYRGTMDFAVIPQTLFVRVSGDSKTQNGYVDREDYGCATGAGPFLQQSNCLLGKEGGKDYSAGRIAVRWLASDTFEVNASADVTIDHSEVAATTLQAVVNTPATAALGLSAKYIPTSPYVSYATFCTVNAAGQNVCWAPATDTRVWGTNLTLDWKLADALAIKSITALREYQSQWVEDNDTSPADVGLGAENLENREFSEELRLNGAVSTFIDYTVGGYYYTNDTTYGTHQILNYASPPGAPAFEFLGDDPVKAKSEAAFANATWHIVQDLNLNAGVRYTKESKDYTFQRNNANGTPNGLLGALDGYTGHYSGDKVDYRVNVDYRWNENLMTYAEVSTGFKGGGISPRPFIASQVVPFAPETLTAYEIGAKSDFLDRRIRLNVSLFENKFKDIQETLLSCPQFSLGIPGFPCAVPVNAGDATIKGEEVELEVHPIEHLSIEGSFSHLNFQFTSLNPSTGIPLSAEEPGTVNSKFSTGIQYDAAIPGAGTVSPRLDWSYTGSFHSNAIPGPNNLVEGYHVLNGHITYKPSDLKWEFSVAGTNLLNKVYYYSNFDLTSEGGGASYGMIAPPRTLWFNVKKKF
jgi:iron complex outermembrane receptor protein